MYVPDLACRCAKKAKAKGWTFFGLQFYGKDIFTAVDQQFCMY